MTEGRQALSRRSVVILAVVAAAVLALSLGIARSHVIAPSKTPGNAATEPPLVLQGVLTRRVPWTQIQTTGSYDGRQDHDNRHVELQAFYRGEPLYKLIGLVDDNDPNTFNVAKARSGYGIKLYGSDGYVWTVDSRTIIGKNDWIIAKLRDGKPLPKWEGPYRFVGASFIGFRAGESVKLLVRVQLVPR